MPGTLFVVATPIGNLEDITARALRVLAEVGLIAAEDTRRTARLLARYAIRTPMTSVHAHNEHKKSKHVVDRLLAGDSVALVSDAGTPALSDPGASLVRSAVEAGIKVEPIPGPSAVTSLLSVSGVASPAFVFLGFPPIKGAARRRWFDTLRSAGRTAIIFEAPHRIRTTLTELAERCGDPQLVVGREMTKLNEEICRGRASEMVESLGAIRGEITILVEIGHTTVVESGAAHLEAESDTIEIGQSTNKMASVGRGRAAAVAKILGLKTNDVYAAFLKVDKSVE